jgi:hypothetical protein
MNGNTVSYERVSYTPVMVDMSRPGATPYAKGGLARSAKRVAGAGEGGDSMIVHVNKAEFEEMVRHFGPPERNPQTGMYAFKPFWKQKWFKEWAAPVATVALSAIAPGVGTALGAGLGLTGTAASTVGTGLIGAGLGGLTGGGKGALTGALTGGLAGYALPAAGITGTPAADGSVFSGGIFSPTGGSGIAPAINNLFNGAPAAAAAAPGAAAPAGGAAAGGSGGIGGAAAGGAGGAAAGGAGGAAAGGTSMLNRVGQLAALGLVANAALGGGGSSQSGGATPAPQQNDPNMSRPLPQVEFSRTRTQPTGDMRRYAIAGGERDFYEDNELPEMPRTAAAMGGLMRAAQGRYVKGDGHGREDRIPALLSDGEYVFDAETVSMLGDGSSDAGAKKLDQMREQIRKHKAGGLARGRMSPDAKDPSRYLKMAG